MMAVGLLNAAYSNTLPLILGRLGGTTDLGILQRARGFAALPSSNLGAILSNVSFPVLSKLQDSDEILANNYRRMIRVSSFIVFPIMIMLCVLARPVVIFLITDKWESCIVLLQIMCFAYMLQPMQILNLNLLQVKGRTDLSLNLELIKKSIFIPVTIVAVQYGLVVLCITGCVLTMIALLLNTYYTGKLIKVGYLKQIRDVLPSLILSLIMGAIVSYITSLIASPIIQIIIGGIIGLLIYISGAKLMNRMELQDVYYMLRFKKVT